MAGNSVVVFNQCDLTELGASCVELMVVNTRLFCGVQLRSKNASTTYSATFISQLSIVVMAPGRRPHSQSISLL